jgi:hypothetical protein
MRNSNKLWVSEYFRILLLISRIPYMHVPRAGVQTFPIQLKHNLAECTKLQSTENIVHLIQMKRSNIFDTRSTFEMLPTPRQMTLSAEERLGFMTLVHLDCKW